MLIDEKQSIWSEKYKPQTIDDVILPEKLRTSIKTGLENGTLPNLGLWSYLPGLGKSSLANAIANHQNVEAYWVNASLNKGIDLIRNEIHAFASRRSISNKLKVVIMDECLDENEEVILIEDNKEVPKKLKDLEIGKIYKCKSFNMNTGSFEDDTCEVVSSKNDTIYQVELADGRTIKVTDNHPFIVRENGKFIQKSIKEGLNENDDIVCYFWYFENSWKGWNVLIVKSFGSEMKIKSIKRINEGHVINLTVHKNHTFITKNGIVTHNCDRLTPDAQAAYRGFIDEFSNNCRFVFTGNYKENIIEPLLNRLENYDFVDFNKTDMVPQIVNRILFILNNENIKFDNSSIRKIIDKNYPSVRGMIVDLKKYSSTGELNVSGISNDELSEIITALKSKNFENLSKSVQNLSCPDAFFSVLYKNIDKLFSKPEQISKAIVILAKYQDMGTRVRDKYLNILACFCELNAICWV